MKTYFTCLAILLLSLFCSCSTSNIYFVRHAEKESVADNPHLTAAGRSRAIALCDSMLNKNLAFVFSTDSNRTIETAQPTATRLRLNITRYSNNQLQTFEEILKNTGRSTLVVGHSNTLLPIIHAFGLTTSMNNISDSDFDNMFIVTRRKNWDGSLSYQLRETHYGVFTAP